MRAEKGQSESGVIQRLIDAPQRFEFFQAVSLVLAFLRSKGISEDQAFARVLRFENSTSMAFPASELEDLRTGADINQGIVLTPAFIGFLGGRGVLPYHYTERIVTNLHEDKAAGSKAFFDLFANRLIGQFFLAWRKYRLEQAVTRGGQDRQKPIVLALAGARDQGGLSDQVLAYYAALFRTRPASAHVIGRAMSEFFGVTMRLEECVGCWDAIPSRALTCLGAGQPRLGWGATLGARLWRHDRRVRLHIGPLGRNNLDRFLPRTAGAVAIEHMLALFDIGHIGVEVSLILGPECIGPLVLTNATAPFMGRLGWTSFLTTSARDVAQPRVRYMLHLS